MPRIVPAVRSLRNRVVLLVTLLIVGSLCIAAGAVLGILSLDQNHGVSVRGYQELREVYEVGAHLVTARSALNDDRPGTAQAAVDSARSRLTAADDPGGAIDEEWLDDAPRNHLAATLRETSDLLGKRSENPQPAAASLNAAIGELSQIASDVRIIIEAHERSAVQSRRAVLLHISVLSLVITAVGVALGFGLYRSVLKPIDRMESGVRRFAAGELDHRLTESGDREFAALCHSFNDMARDLQSFHRQLEERVEMKSRQLVQSERLASVGYLAAGVAHEINNPLSIIAGYGERSLQLLGRADEGSRGAVAQAIQIICDEAFRCKQITDRLLMLARPGETNRAKISVARVAGDVVNSLGGLQRFADRCIVLAAEHDDQVTVLAAEGELRQVILNLLVNALEAVSPNTGEVRVDVNRNNDTIELTVRDNGRDMSAETIQRVYEPLFTQKRAERPGTGLGLSVAHAIVADCGGSIAAFSDGPGLGSRFVVTFPSATEQFDAV